jgi:DNA (cytosine-5)-methyltransferase 1
MWHIIGVCEGLQVRCLPQGAHISSAQLSKQETGEKMIVDLFAGPGGWSQGLRMLNPELVETEIGFEWDKAACDTRAAAGFNTIQTDIAQYPLEQLKGKVTGLIASPPCQDFSLAGKRAGIDGERGQLIREVLRWVDALQPEWVACEQVPPALPVWRDYAEVLRGWGFHVWCGVLNAADYGVPQTRKRAFLIAHKTRVVGPPEPTHAQVPEPSLFGDALQPWVTMADALGWGRRKPVWTLCSGLSDGGGHGADRWMSGGSSIRNKIDGEIGNGEWVLNSGQTESQRNRSVRPLDQPAPTIAFGCDASSWKWEIRPVLRKPNGFKVLPWDSAAPTVKPKDGHARFDDVAFIPVFEGETFIEYEDGKSRWALTRPATTVVSSFVPEVIAAPSGGEPGTSRQNRPGSIRIEISDALVLQSFPADYPLQGSKTKQFQQVGNAVPPRLAMHVLAMAMGVGVP